MYRKGRAQLFASRRPAPLARPGARQAPSPAAPGQPGKRSPGCEARGNPGAAVGTACAAAGGRCSGRPWVLPHCRVKRSAARLRQHLAGGGGLAASAEQAPARWGCEMWGDHSRGQGWRGRGPSAYINPAHLHNGFYKIKSEEAFFFSFLLEREENRWKSFAEIGYQKRVVSKMRVSVTGFETGLGLLFNLEITRGVLGENSNSEVGA